MNQAVWMAATVVELEGVSAGQMCCFEEGESAFAAALQLLHTEITTCFKFKPPMVRNTIDILARRRRVADLSVNADSAKPRYLPPRCVMQSHAKSRIT
jgi:hypothetical protein